MTKNEMDSALPGGEIHASADGSNITWDRPGKPSIRVNPKSILPYTNPPQPMADRGDSAAPSNTASKQLDKATAMSILQETHGDKDKARELARQRGYAF